jgi:SAM-dependent methyltransferase
MTSGAEDRYEREQHFHDHCFTEDVRASLDRWYYVARASLGEYDSAVRKAPPGARTLELGCGVHTWAFDLAVADAHPTAIDISPVAIEWAEQTAAERGITGATFAVMNAEKLEYPDDTFDMVHGCGVLHHLDLDRTLPDIRRVLKPDGRFVFVEPMGHNPAINAFRRRTPQMRTEDEHPLMAGDLAIIQRHFPATRVRRYHLTSLIAGFLYQTPLADPVARVLERLDGLLLKLPILRNWCWMVVIEG